MRAIFCFSAMAALVAASCGGNVVVDGTSPLGSGGSSGTTASTSSGGDTSSGSGTSSGSTTGPSTSSSGGPTCACDEVCAAIEPCMGDDMPTGCTSWCNSFSPAQRDCMCKADACGQVYDCFTGTDPGGGGSSSGGSTSSGGAWACQDCTDASSTGTCDWLVEACEDEPPCEAMLECVEDCNWTQSCQAECQAQIPGPKGTFFQMTDCVVCQSCGEACGSWWGFGPLCGPDKPGGGPGGTPGGPPPP